MREKSFVRNRRKWPKFHEDWFRPRRKASACGADAVLPRRSSGASRYTPPRVGEPFSALISMRAPTRPSSWRGWLTVVSCGVTKSENSMPSKPTIDTSCGTRTPPSVTVFMNPMAMKSLAANMAVGRSARARKSRPAATPELEIEISRPVDRLARVEAAGLDPAFEPCAALHVVDVVPRAGNVAEAPVTETQEMPHGGERCLLVVDHHERQPRPGNAHADGRHGQAGRAHRPAVGGGNACAHRQHPVDLAREDEVDVTRLAGGQIVEVADDDPVSGRDQLVVDAAQDLGKERSWRCSAPPRAPSSSAARADFAPRRWACSPSR